MKLSSKAAAVNVDERDTKNTGERDWTCRHCGQHLKGNWGHCMDCHLTFPQQAGFDRHRTGQHENRAIGQENTRRCLTADELAERGWQHDTESGLWRLPLKKASA